MNLDLVLAHVGAVNMELVLGVPIGLLVFVFLVVLVLKAIVVICPPNRVVVISGRASKTETGERGYRIIFGGRAHRIPIFEQVEEMDLTTIPINLSVHNAYSKGGIALHVQAVANVKISSDRKVVGAAIQRFLGRARSDIVQASKDTLEGNLREVVATLSPEQVNEDRLTFAKEVSSKAERDLAKLGMHLDTLKIQHVADNESYLESIGRQSIALIVRDAEIAESNARRDAESVAAKVRAEAQVVKETTLAVVARSRNNLREYKAELEAITCSEEERTEAAALEARAFAEQELQTIRIVLEQLRLQADKVIPAEAMKKAREMQAKAAAAPIAENGKALAQALSMMSDAWTEAGDSARDIFLIQQLERILSIVVARVNNMEIGEVHLVDGGEGNAIPNYVQSFPATVTAILHSLAETTGVDVTSILAGSGGILSSKGA